jgi:peptide/nickel transport system permease protein
METETQAAAAFQLPHQPATDRFWRRFRRNRGAVIGLSIVVFMVLLAVLAPVIAPHDPATQHSGRKLEPPSPEFPLGTDNLSRDLLSRIVYGARPSLGAAFAALSLIVSLGTILGAVSGYVGGWLDEIIMRIVDVLLAFPGLILALAIVGILGQSLGNVILGVVLVSWAGYARLVRGMVLEVRERLFVQAAISIGVPQRRIILRHIIPNIISPIIILASLEMGILILTIAGLNFLGLGIQPPTPEWGAMLNQGRTFFQRAPQLMILPGLMISLTVLGFNLLGDGLRDVLDPHHKDR